MPHDDVFDALRGIMEPYTRELVVSGDRPGYLYLDTADVTENGKPRWFGGVQ